MPNFGVVSAGCLYRSGQPVRSGFEWLRHEGVRSIVSLRAEYDDRSDGELDLRFNYLHLPVEDDRAPTDQQAEAFLGFLSQPAHWPLLVHCRAGEGRTGCFVALARYTLDGWSMNRALVEARLFRRTRWLPAIRWFRGKLSADQLRFLKRWTAAHPRGPAR